jgi:hypothetical protein
MTVTFMQRYRSDSHHDEVEKPCDEVKLEGKWLIAEEQAGKASQGSRNEPAGVSAQPLNANQQAAGCSYLGGCVVGARCG